MNMHRSSLAAGVATVVLFAVMVPLAAAGVTVQEASLNPTGEVYELNRDAAGNLIISEWGSDEVWHVNAATSAYTVYEGIEYVVDARPDATGAIWWTDSGAVFGRIDVQAGTLTTWDLGGTHNRGARPSRPTADQESQRWPAQTRAQPDAPTQDHHLWGVAFDDAGGVWLPEWDSSESGLYRFDPATTELCTHSLPDGVSSQYALYDDGVLWLGDEVTERLVRYDPAAGEGTYWEVGSGSMPIGLALDVDGNLWYADWWLANLGRLEPDIDRLTTYDVPAEGWPVMIIHLDGGLWYTEDYWGTVGVLDPALATGTSTILSTGTQTATITCDLLGPGTTTPVEIRSGTLTWTEGQVTPNTDTEGWTVYELPGGGLPYGLVGSEDTIWITDFGRQKLLRFGLEDVLPEIAVVKTADPTSVPETGATVDYTIAVSNLSGEPITLNSLVDDRFGDISAECGLPVSLAVSGEAGDSFTCTINRFISGDYPGSHVNVVTATATDDEGNEATDTGTATVGFGSRIYLPLVVNAGDRY